MNDPDRLASFSQGLLGGRPVPEDLAILLEAYWNGRPGPLAHLEFRFFEPGESHDLLDHSYLSADERANPGMAACLATDEVARHAVFFAEGINGDLFGYWVHGDQSAAGPLPVVTLDTEGQFELLAGRTFTEAIVGKWALGDDETFAECAGWFAQLGVPLQAQTTGDLIRPDVGVDPARLHDEVYQRELVRLRPS